MKNRALFRAKNFLSSLPFVILKRNARRLFIKPVEQTAYRQAFVRQAWTRLNVSCRPPFILQAPPTTRQRDSYLIIPSRHTFRATRLPTTN